jgi:hypothetical protein
VIHWFSHDSIGLGEDGPTHQPVEQLASLRAIPGLNVIRPCDANEVVEAWRVMMQQRHQPTALVLTRQDVPIFDRSKYASAEGLARGGYVFADSDDEPEVILIATGSEVALAVSAYEELRSDGVQARVVSLPSWYLFDLQDDEYRESVLPKSVQAGSVVPSALEGSLQPQDGFKQDLDKAKQALAAAGNPDGFSFTLSYASDETAAGLPMSLVANAIQSDLAKVGIKAKLDPELEVNFLSAYREGKLDAVVHGWANDYPNTSDFLPVFVPPGTVAVKRQHWPASAENQQIFDLAANAFKTKDDTQRADMITQALKLLNEKGPYAPLLDTEYQFAYDKSQVSNVTANSERFIDLGTLTPAG